MRETIKRLGAAISYFVADSTLEAIAIAGAGAITYGVDLIYRPAAFIAAGSFLLAGAWLLARKGG